MLSLQAFHCVGLQAARHMLHACNTSCAALRHCFVSACVMVLCVQEMWGLELFIFRARCVIQSSECPMPGSLLTTLPPFTATLFMGIRRMEHHIKVSDEG